MGSLKRGPLPEWKEKKNKQKRELMIAQCKQSWEKARVGHLSDKERKPLIESLMNQITGHVEEILLKHDASRIIQCCIKYGTQEDIKKIYGELKPKMNEFIKSKYGKFIVLALLNHCKSLRPEIMALCTGRVEELLKNKDSAFMIEVIYHTYASPKQKKSMVSELYSIQVCKNPQLNGMVLSKIIEENPSLNEVIKTHMRKLLFTLVQKGGLGDMTIILRALVEFISLYDAEEFVDLLQEQVVEFLHHKDGMRVANYLIRKANAKSRKIILKSFKPHLAKIYMEEYGHLVLLTAFRCVDDTKMMHKYLISDIILNLDSVELLTNQFSRRVLAYLLTMSIKLVPNNYAIMLAEDDLKSESTSKKDAITRFDELKEAAVVESMSYIIVNCKSLMTTEGIDLLESLFTFGDENTSNQIIKAMQTEIEQDPSVLGNIQFRKLATRCLKSPQSNLFLTSFEPFIIAHVDDLVASDSKYLVTAFLKTSDNLKSILKQKTDLDMTFWSKHIE